MKAKSIMITGTMSSAGKSFITAGLCRIFKQDGFRTAPFKAQNMALNSYITSEGLEIGRAQAMQSESAGIEPDVRMNPILLKPVSNKGSQVIVNGEVYGTMSATEYYKHKKEFIPHIMKSYNSLAEEFDIIVLEGAGSPAEINLKAVDIVNMGMAKMSKSPVILAGDIDRGGVFASLYGTVALMDDEEREMIKGLIINKFRGDISILQSGLDMIENLTGKTMLGTIPYIDIDLDDEDSLSERFKNKKDNADVDIAIIRLPRISNFTDFNIFETDANVSLRYVSSVSQLGNPDMIIIPGTKNTISDLQWLRQSGLEASILKKSSQGVIVWGICGGFQMLGNEISDPYNIENGGTVKGMGLLDIKTVFEKNKVRSRTSAKINNINGIMKNLSGKNADGYEIHMGVTENCGNAIDFTMFENGNIDGYMNYEGTVFGTYLHGIFDSISSDIISCIMKNKGIDKKSEKIDFRAYKEKQYDILADELRKALDIQKIYEIIEKGI